MGYIFLANTVSLRPLIVRNQHFSAFQSLFPSFFIWNICFFSNICILLHRQTIFCLIMKINNMRYPLALLLFWILFHTLSAQVHVTWTPQQQQELGMVEEGNGIIERHFKAFNTGTDSWQVLRGYTSCGCTTVQIEKERVVRPSDSTNVIVRFNPASKTGPFKETVTIQLSDGEQTFNQTLILSGEVKSSKESINKQFPFALSDGGLRISTENIDFGEVKRDTKVERHIALLNTGQEPCVVSLQTKNPSLLISDSSITLSPDESQDITLTWDGSKDVEWGSVKSDLTITTNKARQMALVKLSAILLPNAGNLNAAELARAPQLKTERRIELSPDAIKQGTIQYLNIQNTGGSTLQLLRIYSHVPNVKVRSHIPVLIEPGKMAKIEVEIIPDGTKEFPITLISNDAKKPRQTVRIYIK